MRLFISLSIFCLLATGCVINFDRVEGDGNRTIRESTPGDFNKLEISGSFKVNIIPDDEHRVVIETDDNLHRYILVDRDGSRLKLRLKNNVNIRSRQGIMVTVYMPEVRRIELAGSGVVRSSGTLKASDEMELVIAGSGEIDMPVDCPKVDANIGGSGTIRLQGATRDLKVNIGGSGDFVGPELLAENTKVRIGGSGSARVYASIKLDASIAGSGNVYYGGKPSVSQQIAGSGSVKPL